MNKEELKEKVKVWDNLCGKRKLQEKSGLKIYIEHKKNTGWGEEQNFRMTTRWPRLSSTGEEPTTYK